MKFESLRIGGAVAFGGDRISNAQSFMAPPLETRILTHLKSERYRPQPPRRLARELNLEGEETYHAFRNALKELMHEGRVVLGAGGTVMLPSEQQRRDEFV